MRKLLYASLLAMLLAVSVSAGEVNGPPAPAPTPPSGTSSMTSTTYLVLLEAILGLIKK